MATYANRTCNGCGIRLPQPQMYQKEIYVESGRSRAGISKSTFFASMFGDEKAAKQIQKSLYNTGQRTYQRKKLIWVCSNCRGKVRSKLGLWEFFRKLINFIVFSIITLIVIIGLFA